MRFESVHAEAFGPFVDRTLELAPGFTIVFGPNEAGKSRWHMALYAGLCGMRRGRGQPSPEDRDFRSRYRPWGGDKWQVAAFIQLEDRRRIELRHDLDGRVDVRATDRDLGRDYSDEIMVDGAPDGSKWLGLDRKSFLKVACVRQSDVLGVLTNPDSLQEYLQRAAASSRADATAAAAIESIDAYSRENIGTHAATTKPLRRSEDRLARAEAGLAETKRKHSLYVGAVADADRLTRLADEAQGQLSLLEAAKAVTEASEIEHRLDQADQLGDEFPTEPPTDAAHDDELGRDVAAALQSWIQRPPIPELSGPSAADLRANIAALPAMPLGDLVPEPTLVKAVSEYRERLQVGDLHRGTRPAEPKPIPIPGITAIQLRDLARDLQVEAPAVDPDIEARVAAARLRWAEVSNRRRPWILLGLGIGLIALGGFVLVFRTIGIVPIAVGVGLVLWYVTHSSTRSKMSALEELRNAEEPLGSYKYQVDETMRRRSTASETIHRLGLLPDPEALMRIAADIDNAATATERLTEWNRQQLKLESELGLAGEAAQKALESRSGDTGTPILDSYSRYEEACRRRAAVAALAGQKEGIERQLADRERVEAMAAQARQQNEMARTRLRKVAEECGVSSSSDDELAGFLQEWQKRRVEALSSASEAHQKWANLLAILDGKPYSDLEQRAVGLRLLAERTSAGLDPAKVEALRKAGDLSDRLQTARSDAAARARAAATGRGQVKEMEKTLASVSDIEEELAAAQQELARLASLTDVLGTTRRFLVQAQERVHRDIAPVLRSAIDKFLASITAGRYSESTVDPQNLKIMVRATNGQWRDAQLLSHGTTEQIYLLLRVAMAEHLTIPTEVCPLILDDVTVQCDEGRKTSVLELLHTLSRDRQVILFSQEADVLRWAEATLRTPRDRLVSLDPALIGA